MASITRIPAPLTVNRLPDIVPAAVLVASIVNTTGLPDAPPVAVSAIGVTPYVTGVGGAVNVITCVANFAATVAAADVIAL